MNIPFRQTLAALSIVSLALFPAARDSVAAIPSPERILPEDTLLVLTVPDYVKLDAVTKNSPQTQFWNDPAVKPFRDKFIAKLKTDLLQPLERDLGIRFADYENLLQGQLTIAVTQNGWRGTSEKTPGLLLLLDTKDKSSQLKANLAEVRRKWVDAGKVLKTEKIRGLDFTVLPISSKDIPPTLKKLFTPNAEDEDGEADSKAPKNEVVFGQFESLLIAGNSVTAVEQVVALLTGSGRSLGDLAAFDANRLALFRDAPAYGWANAKTFIDVMLRNLMAEAESSGMMPQMKADTIANSLGVGGLKTVAFTFQNLPEGVLLHFFVGAPESGRQGLLKLFPTPGKESGPPPFVPADAVKFQRMRLDGQKLWATIEKIVNDMSPGGLNMFVEMANAAVQEKDPGFDLRKNFIGNLGDDMISYQKGPTGTELADVNSGPLLFLLGSPRPEQLVSALKLVFGIMGGQGGPTEREFLGRKIYSSALPSFLSGALGTGTSRGARPTFNFAASSGYVAFAIDGPILEEYLRSSDSQQKKLRDTPGLSDAVARVGGSSTGWFTYENQVETSRVAFEALRKSGKPSAESMLAAGIPAFTPSNPLKDWVDFTLLPPFEKIAKYFHFMVYSGAATAEGLSFKVFYPVPPQLRK